MRYLIKYAGIVSVAASLSLFGFFKTRLKKTYINRLKKISVGLQKADDLLKFGETNRERILAVCFGAEVDFMLKDGILAKPQSSELCGLLKEFSREFGSGDLVAEHRRIALLKHAVDGIAEREESEYAQFSKIWQTAGVCAGLALGIMLI